jgi:hypothetical protein
MASRTTRKHADDLRGLTRLATSATEQVTNIVESMHHTVAGGPSVLGRPLEGLVRLLTAPVYGSIRGVTRLVGAGLDAALTQLGPALGEGVPRPGREAVIAALNGVLGDYLEETGNPLAIEMALRKDGGPLDMDPAALRATFPDARTGVVVLVHGSSMSDLAWRRGETGFGAALSRDLGLDALHLRYNSGLHVSINGQRFADLLEQLVAAWPRPIEQIVIVAHSMGGLVSRSACRAGEQAGHSWRRALDAIVFLGTPHHGAPLERGGAWLQHLVGISRYSAPLAALGRLRSAGVTDLRHGDVLDADWRGRDRFHPSRREREQLPLPDGVRCFAVAGTTSARGARRLLGDGLVPVRSALGQHDDPSLDLGFPDERTWIAYGTGHIALLDRPEVYARVLAWLRVPPHAAAKSGE